ncbi:MAG TPA: PASTA domain-containing protein [Bacteroidales bacterium]|nr:PASTA domain-containing protein [Bacteroidales bacterium]
MTLKEFLTSKLFIRHLLLSIPVGIVFLWIAMSFLDIYTLHGRTITVPDLKGLTVEEASEKLKDLNLRYHINDSIFDDFNPRGSIVRQDPDKGSEVKRNRTIYLTKVAILSEKVPMPALIDLSFRQALALLNAYGLDVGNLEYRPDIAQNAILQQKFRAQEIEPGTLIEKGSSIDLVIGMGLGEALVEVPLLIGMTRREAISALHAVSLSLGTEDFLDDKNDNPMVYQQTPDPTLQIQTLQAGSSVNLVYRSGNLFDFEEYLAGMLTVTVPMLFGKTPEEVRAVLAQNFLELGNETFEGNVSKEDARVYMQMPDYGENGRIKKGDRIDVWYRSIDDF